MAAAQYYQTDSLPHDQQHLLLSSEKDSHHVPYSPRSPLKPLHLLSKPGHHRSYSYEDNERLRELEREDQYLKARIRRLRFVSRFLALLISIAVLVPMTLTVVKFLQTQNTYRDVTNPQGNTVRRTAWAKDTKSWPTWMYFLVAVISVVLNFITIFSYKFGVSRANRASCFTSFFTWVVMLGNLVVWSVAAALYRTEKDKNGKSNDLWGWTCSAAARAIQKEFAREVNFNMYCNVQTASFYIGIVQAGATAFAGLILIVVLFRNQSKKKIRKHIRSTAYPSSSVSRRHSTT